MLLVKWSYWRIFCETKTRYLSNFDDFISNKIKIDYIGWTLDARSIYDLVYEFVLIILITQIIAG